MRPASPQETLTNQTPMQRFEEKASLACAWVGLFGHSTEAVLRDLLGIQGRGLCPWLARKGLLIRVRIPGAASSAWALTAAGVLRAEFALHRRIAYLTHPSRLSLARFAHDLAVQREVLARINTDLSVLRGLRADRELQQWSAPVRPDVLIRRQHPNGESTIVCLEVELSSKGTTELRRKMEQLLAVLRPNMLWCWYISEGEAARARYEATWSSVVAEEGDGRGLSQEWIRQACRFDLAIGTRLGSR